MLLTPSEASTFNVAWRENLRKNFKKNDLKNLEKPQHFRLSSPKIPKPLMLQQHALGMLVISNLLFFNIDRKAGAFSRLGTKSSITPLFGQI